MCVNQLAGDLHNIKLSILNTIFQAVQASKWFANPALNSEI